VERGKGFPLSGFKFILAAGEPSLYFVCFLFIATASLGKRCNANASFINGGAIDHSKEDFPVDMQIMSLLSSCRSLSKCNMLLDVSVILWKLLYPSKLVFLGVTGP
jgi:hypothetical protein